MTRCLIWQPSPFIFVVINVETYVSGKFRAEFDKWIPENEKGI